MASRSSSESRFGPDRPTRTSPTCAPSRRRWATSWKSRTKDWAAVSLVRTFMGDYTEYEGNLDAGGMRIAVVASRFNDDVTKLLLEGALQALAGMGLDPDSVPVVWVPGAFEIALVAKQLAKSGERDAVICV